MSVVLVDKYVKNFVGEHEYANIQGAISAAHEAFVNKSGAGSISCSALLLTRHPFTELCHPLHHLEPHLIAGGIGDDPGLFLCQNTVPIRLARA